MDIKFKKALFLSPHIDDVEFGCGGTISKLINQGTEVYYLAFSDCANSIIDKFPKDIMKSELMASSDILGIDKTNIEVQSFEVRHFQDRRQDILQRLIDIKRELAPDVVFTPSTADIHQDHIAITQECIRAFKDISILGYELPWNCLHFNYDVIIKLEEKDLDKKIKAINCYHSQSHRIYHNEEYLKAMALTRGLKINEKFAEVFELIRLTIK